MSSGMFRGKESSNRIELSRLVQDLLNFGVLGSLQLWGGGRWVGGIWGHGRVSPTHMHVHACTHAHLYNLQMATDMDVSMFRMFSMFNMHVHACACVSAWDTPTHPYPPPPPSTHLPPPRVDSRNHLKFDNTSTYQDISIPFEICEEFPTHGCVWFGGLMGGVRSNH